MLPVVADAVGDIGNALADEFRTDPGRANLATVLVLALVMSTDLLKLMWAGFHLAAFTVLALFKRVPDDFDAPSAPQFSTNLAQGSIIALTGIASIFLVQNVILD